MSETRGPIIVWIKHGYEGWHPTTFDTLKDALDKCERYGSEFVVTKLVKYDVVEIDDDAAVSRS